MPESMTFSATTAKSGWIIRAGFAYTVNTAEDYYRCGVNLMIGLETRGFLSFDTSAIPDDAEILSASIYWDIEGNVSGGATCPSTWATKIYVGTFIGAALDSADWNGGTEDQRLVSGPIDQDIWLVVPSLINAGGETDFRFKDDSNWLAGCGGYSWWAWKAKGTRLLVTYQRPSLRHCDLYHCDLYHA